MFNSLYKYTNECLDIVDTRRALEGHQKALAAVNTEKALLAQQLQQVCVFFHYIIISPF